MELLNSLQRNRRIKYDFIFSIGKGCSCSYNLRRCGFQKSSLPFDWVVNESGLDIHNVFADNFARYLQKENLEKILTTEDGAIYKDKLYNIKYVHDFPNSRSFETNFNELKQKITRRTIRLIKNIKSSKNILMIFENGNANYDINKIHYFLQQMAKVFPQKNFNLIYLIYDKNFPTPEYIFVDRNLKIIKFDNTADSWSGNEANWDKILGEIELSFKTKLLFILKQLFR